MANKQKSKDTRQKVKKIITKKVNRNIKKKCLRVRSSDKYKSEISVSKKVILLKTIEDLLQESKQPRLSSEKKVQRHPKVEIKRKDISNLKDRDEIDENHILDDSLSEDEVRKEHNDIKKSINNRKQIRQPNKKTKPPVIGKNLDKHRVVKIHK
uniref:Uncharacterized protein n=1 Tax=Clastoptera arizonana TaxID=38151 RepID=A0A1B6CVS8_9HEMI